MLWYYINNGRGQIVPPKLFSEDRSGNMVHFQNESICARNTIVVNNSRGEQNVHKDYIEENKVQNSSCEAFSSKDLSNRKEKYSSDSAHISGTLSCRSLIQMKHHIMSLCDYGGITFFFAYFFLLGIPCKLIKDPFLQLHFDTIGLKLIWFQRLLV